MKVARRCDSLTLASLCQGPGGASVAKFSSQDSLHGLGQQLPSSAAPRPRAQAWAALPIQHLLLLATATQAWPDAHVSTCRAKASTRQANEHILSASLTARPQNPGWPVGLAGTAAKCPQEPILGSQASPPTSHVAEQGGYWTRTVWTYVLCRGTQYRGAAAQQPRTTLGHPSFL